MKLTVYKDNQPIDSINFASEVNTQSGKMSFLMGRSSTCHVVLDSPQVSRELAELSHTAGIWMIKRSSDLNQLVINGASVQEKVLSNGDMIASGPFIISVELPQLGQVAAPAQPMPESQEIEEESEAATETIALDENEATQALESPELGEDDLDGSLDDDLGGDLDDDDLGAGLDSELEDSDGVLEANEEEVFGTEEELAEFEAGEAEAEDFGEASEFESDNALDILDDDIIINTTQLKNLFEILIRYDLSVIQPAYLPIGKISHKWLTTKDDSCFLRFVNFIEMTAPVFSRKAINTFMSVYDPKYYSMGVDVWYMKTLGETLPKKYAIIDDIGVINPKDVIKGGRELFKDDFSHEKKMKLYQEMISKFGCKLYKHIIYKKIFNENVKAYGDVPILNYINSNPLKK